MLIVRSGMRNKTPGLDRFASDTKQRFLSGVKSVRFRRRYLGHQQLSSVGTETLRHLRLENPRYLDGLIRELSLKPKSVLGLGDLPIHVEHVRWVLWGVARDVLSEY